jgi:hypothetical protein
MRQAMGRLLIVLCALVLLLVGGCGQGDVTKLGAAAEGSATATSTLDETAVIFDGVNGPIWDWKAPQLLDYTDKALRAMPELAAASYLHGVGLALSGDSSEEVRQRLRDAAELDPDETLFQQTMAYWEGR